MTHPAHARSAASGAAIAAAPASTAHTPGPDRPADPEPPRTTWPHHFLSLPGIQRWIAGALSPAHGPITGVDLVEVYEAKTRAVTARFTLHAGTTRCEDVVFKTTLQPLFYYAPLVDRLYSLYRPFSGPLVRALLRATSSGDSSALRAATEAVAAVSRAFARLQVGVAEAPASMKEAIPHLLVAQLPRQGDSSLVRRGLAGVETIRQQRADPLHVLHR
jgi:hypothetical protein